MSKAPVSPAMVTGHFDPAQSYLSPPTSGLSRLFKPQSVAIIGATERQGSVGRTCVDNLIKSNEGHFQIFPVSKARDTVLGLKAYKSIADCPGKVDLAVVITPAATVKGVVEECGLAGVGSVVIITAGFKEIGPEGQKMEEEIIEIARKHGVRVVGPNCLGVMQPNYGLNATFASCMAYKGNLAFASQSGAMCTAVLDWANEERMGLSSFVSIGSMADVDWGDIITYLGNDPLTKSILIYMETIGNPRSFLSAAKEVAAEKPIIVIKAGKSEAAAKAAASHTGSLAGAHDAFLAAMRRVGVMTVDTIGELFNCALALGKQPRPRGPRLLIITNAGGPGVLATDAVALNGGEVAQIPEPCVKALDEILPPAWSHANPIDVLGDAPAELYARTLEVAFQHQDCFDGVLVVLSPQSVTEPFKTAEKLVETVERLGAKISKPVYASWMGGKDTNEGFELLNRNSIPAYRHPDAAAKTFARIWHNTRDVELMAHTPGVVAAPFVAPEARETAMKILKVAHAQGRELLTEAESKEVLKAFGLPVAETIICKTVDEAAAAGVSVKFPCVVKLNSETITHKSDVGGVKLNINSEQAVRNAFNDIKTNVDKIGPNHFQGVTVQPMLAIERGIELIFGCITDPQLGPLVAFGSGGCMVEIYKDSSLSVPPLNAVLADRQIQDTKVYQALKGGHGERFPGVPLDELNKCLVSFSHMVCELSDLVSEIDVNPLLALPDRMVSLDARIVIRKADEPAPPLAVRPYPREYITEAKLNEGSDITIRPTHPGDFEEFTKFHKLLSEKTIRQRYLRDSTLDERIAQQKLAYTCCADYDRLIALLAVKRSDPSESSECYGICRLTRLPTDGGVAELKIAIRDDMQGKGLGSLLLKNALEVAKAEKYSEVRGAVLDENTGFIKMLEKFGFSTKPSALSEKVLECSYTVPTS